MRHFFFSCGLEIEIQVDIKSNMRNLKKAHLWPLLNLYKKFQRPMRVRKRDKCVGQTRKIRKTNLKTTFWVCEEMQVS